MRRMSGRCLTWKFEALAVGAGGHGPYLHGGVVLHPGVAHEGVLLVVERVEDLYGVAPADGLDPNERHGTVQFDDAPVRSVVRDDGTQVVFAVDEFDACLDVVLVVDADHQPRLVEALAVVAADLELDLELAAVVGVVERRVVHGESVVRNPPVVAVRRDGHRQDAVADLPLFGFVVPLHLFQRLGLRGCCGKEHRQHRKQQSFHLQSFALLVRTPFVAAVAGCRPLSERAGICGRGAPAACDNLFFVLPLQR